MNMFKDCDGDMMDLDDMNTYPDEWKDMPVHDLFSKCWEAAGKSLFYMDYLYSDSTIGWGGQIERVDVLCKELSSIWNGVRQMNPDTGRHDPINEEDYRKDLMSWLYRFEDEVENQC